MKLTISYVLTHAWEDIGCSSRG